MEKNIEDINMLASCGIANYFMKNWLFIPRNPPAQTLICQF